MSTSNSDHRRSRRAARLNRTRHRRLFCASRAFPFAPSSTNSMPGPTNSANKVRKSSRATFSTQLRSRRQCKDVKRAYFTYPVADGLLEAATIFAAAARDAGLELVVNNSQFQGTPDDPAFRDLQHAPSFRNLQHRLADRIFDWAQVGAVHLQTPPYYENVRALVSRSVAEQNAAFLPWGDGDAVIPLAGAEDVSRVAATLLANSGAPSENVYPLVSETPTVREIVETLGRAIGRPIRYVPITDEQWADAVKERINPHALDHLTHLWQYFRNGKEHRQATDAIRVVTGRESTDAGGVLSRECRIFRHRGSMRRSVGRRNLSLWDVAASSHLHRRPICHRKPSSESISF